eukprot:COSAG02_NODE_662_length_18752_cov_10.146464_4_plen_54_part_00
MAAPHSGGRASGNLSTRSELSIAFRSLLTVPLAVVVYGSIRITLHACLILYFC